MNRAAIPSALKPAERLIELEGRVISDPKDGFGSGVESEELSWLREKLEAAVRAVCPAWLRHQHEDLVQVAMIAVLKQQEKMKNRRRFPKRYIRRAAFTALVDEIRRRRSRGEVSLEAASEEEVWVEGRAGPERAAFSREISAGIRACLDALASPRSLAVTLHLLAYKVPQIAQMMGWAPKRADNLVYRGMRDLRDCLRGKGLEP